MISYKNVYNFMVQFHGTFKLYQKNHIYELNAHKHNGKYDFFKPQDSRFGACQ